MRHTRILTRRPVLLLTFFLSMLILMTGYHLSANSTSPLFFGSSQRPAAGNPATPAAVGLDGGKTQAPATAYTVNSTADTNTGSGTSGTLRYCITQANLSAGPHTITFSITGTISLTSSLPDINTDLTIDGPGSNTLNISGNNTFRLVRINDNHTVTFQDLTLSNGYANGIQGGAIDSNGNDTVTLQNCVFIHNRATFDGGAVRNNGGNMTVTGCTFDNNTSDEPSGQGGGIKHNGGTLTVTNSTFVNNTADAGGGLHVGTGTISTSLTNCTFSGNSATFGGGVEMREPATFQNCTFTKNVASSVGGLDILFHAATLVNTIVSGNLDPNGNPSDVEVGNGGTVNLANSFNNLIGTPGSTGLTTGTNGNLVGVLDPKVVPVGKYGGSVPTVPIRPSSQARNAGRNTGAPATDARGFNRPQATTVDIGAFELQTNSLVTNTLNSGAGSLRDVITVVPASEIVQFESPLFDSAQTIQLSGGQITLGKDQAIFGPAASLLTIQSTAGASTTSRAFSINTGIIAILGDMKIANNHVTSEGGAISTQGILTVRTCVVHGNTSNDQGAGISNTGTLTVIDSTISNNTATVLDGGGIASFGALTVTGSTFVGNSANVSGGGIAIMNGGALNGSLAATNSTFSANQAAVTGGGISFDTSVTTNTITNCTITLNQQTNGGSSGGGLGVAAGTVTLKNTIVANNTKNDGSQSDITTTGGTVNAASSFNLIGTGGSGGLTNGVNNNQVGVADAKLIALANYGGPTQTHMLSINSPALNVATSSGAPTTDQRGVKRSLGGTFDIGAVEAYITVTPVSIPTGTAGVAYAGQTFSASGGSGDYSFALTGTLPNGMFFSSVGANLSGTPTEGGSFPIVVTATDNTNGIVGASRYTLTINVQVLHHFAISNITSPKTAGTAFNITITAQDSSNATVLGFTGTVNLSTNAGTITPTTSGAFTSGVRTQSVTLTQSGTLKTISVDDGSGHTGTSNTFTVNPGALHHFAIDPISTQTAGTAFNIGITAQDLNNNTVTSYNSTVNMSASSGTISPTTSGAFTSGTRTQSVTLTSAGPNRTITVTDGIGHNGTSNTFTVNGGALHHFVIGNISTVVAGTPFNLAVTAQDINNNTATGFTGTVSLTTTAGTITPTTSNAFTAGTLNQTVTVTQAGTGKTISVDDGAGHTATSNTFTVNPGALQHFAIANITGPQVAGAAFNITITAQDLNNNTVTSFTGTVSLTTTAGTITPTTSNAFTAGTRTQSVTVTQAGTGKTIGVDDGAGHTATSNTFTVNPGALDHFAIGNITSPKIAGTPFNIALTAQDLNNNTVTGFTGTAGLSTTAGTITPTTSSAFTAGTLNQAVTVTQAGTGKTISVDDGAGHTATSNTFTVNPGALQHFAIANITGPQVAGAAFNITITAQDLNNNTVTGFTGTVSLTTTAGAITPATSNAFTAGTRTESVTVTQAGAGRTISVDDGASHTATSNTFTVTNTLTWNGSASSNWNTAANWTPAVVPSAINDVDIPAAGVTNNPALSTAAVDLHNLTIAAGRMLTLSGQDLTVNGLLTLNGGTVNTGGNTLNLGAAATVSRTSGQITGNLKKSFSGAGSFTYPVGTANGYSPVDVTVTAGAGDLAVNAVQGPQPTLSASKSLQRYWSLAGTGITVNLVFHYLDPTDIAGSESAYRIIRVSGGTAAIFPNDCAGGSPCVSPAANTATINGVSSFSDWTAGEPTAPTAVEFASFNAAAYDNGMLLEWQTGYEADNLGFNLYRDEDGKRTLVNQQVIAGSALVAGSVAMRAGRAYAFWDETSRGSLESPGSLGSRHVVYWVEDLDLDGKRVMHGPFTPRVVGGKPPALSQAEFLSQVGQRAARLSWPVTSPAPAPGRGSATAAASALAAQPAVKLTIREAGFYRVSQPELVAAGINPQVDPRRLQLFADGVEQAMLVTGENDGRFDALDTVEFYATGLDTPESDAHIYWLVAGEQAGRRVSILPTRGKTGEGRGFLATIESRERSIYFSSLLNGEAENFFGRIVTAQPVEQAIPLAHLAAAPQGAAELEVALQGVTNLDTTPDHRVGVALNGVRVGEVVFDGREHRVERFAVAQAQLREGNNTVTLTAAGGSSDITLVDYIRVSYWHGATADADALRLTTEAGTQTINGFTSPLIRVLDVTDPSAVSEIIGRVAEQKQGYAVTIDVPSGGARTLLALTDDGIKQPAAITANQPSAWRQPANGADLLILTRRAFLPALAGLKTLRQSQGLSVAVVDVEDIYDEFSFGNKSPRAVKDFLGYAATNWKKKPRYVLLVGEASYDSRDYLGFGDTDLVPTKLIDTALMESASDDWFADFDDDGVPELAVGRLPARHPEDVTRLVAKLVAYESSPASDEALLVADLNDGFDFERASAELRTSLPDELRVNQINRGEMDAATARAALLGALARGQRLVNYSGHGSVSLWRGNLLTNEDAASLSNTGSLSVFVMMTCLNGYFDDPGLESLAESLLKAERGGAVAVWASSGMTLPGEQALMNRQLVQLMFQGGGSRRFGDVVRGAKQSVGDTDIRRTWILLGDPTMRVK